MSIVPPGASDAIMAALTDSAELKQFVAALTLTRASIDHAQDMLYWVRPDGSIVDVNQATCDKLGYSREELLAMNIVQVDPKLTLESYQRAWEELRQQGAVRFETQHRTRGGQLIPVEVSRHIVIHEGREYNCAFGRDITARKEAELRVQHLNRVLEAIRNVNQLITRERDPGLLVDRACKLLVETRGYTDAWILLTAGALGAAHLAAEGFGAGFRAIEGWLQQGILPPCCRAAPRTFVLSLEPFCCGDCPLSDRHQPGQVLAVRLSHEDNNFGYIGVSMPEAFTGRSEEQQLFLGVASDITFALNRILLERERDLAVQRRVALSRQILVAQEEERARLSRELHDELGQILTAVHFELGMLEPRVTAPADELATGLRKADSMVQDAMLELRRLCRGLRPPLLDDLGLVPAVKSLVEEFEKRMAIAIQLEVGSDGWDGLSLPSEVALCVFRVLQEALTNVARHAGPAHVWISLSLSGEGQELVLQIKDDGCGFQLDDPEGERGFGLLGMRERAELVDADLEIESAPGQGTCVCLRVAMDTPQGGDR